MEISPRFGNMPSSNSFKLAFIHHLGLTTIPETHRISHGSSSPVNTFDEVDATIPDEHAHQQGFHYKRMEFDAEFLSRSRINEDYGHDGAS